MQICMSVGHNVADGALFSFHLTIQFCECNVVLPQLGQLFFKILPRNCVEMLHSSTWLCRDLWYQRLVLVVLVKFPIDMKMLNCYLVMWRFCDILWLTFFMDGSLNYHIISICSSAQIDTLCRSISYMFYFGSCKYNMMAFCFKRPQEYKPTVIQSFGK